MGLYVAEPAAPNGRALIVIQEAFGVTAHIASVADRCAAAGYLGLVLHLFPPDRRPGDRVRGHRRCDAADGGTDPGRDSG